MMPLFSDLEKSAWDKILESNFRIGTHYPMFTALRFYRRVGSNTLVLSPWEPLEHCENSHDRIQTISMHPSVAVGRRDTLIPLEDKFEELEDCLKLKSHLQDYF